MAAPPLIDRLLHWLHRSITLRLFALGFLVLLMLIPVSIVEDLVRERQERQGMAIQEVSAKWGYPQIIKGPVLTVPYVVLSKVWDAREQRHQTIRSTHTAHFLPEDLEIQGSITPEVRYRGLYEVVVYRAKVTIRGAFSPPNFAEWNISENIQWGEASLGMGLSDLRGIQQQVHLKWDEQRYSFEPGLENDEVIRTGISARVPLGRGGAPVKKSTFSIDLQFNGSSSLSFIPLGKETRVKVTSRWPDPSFDGAFLPDAREIRAEGFSARWKVLHLNRSFPQQFRGEHKNIDASAFGVRLLMPVDQYVKNTRSVKYAVLFISLTFLVFFFLQILLGVRIHPVQFILIGLGLCIFYILLLSLSEHLGFKVAYLAASVAIVGLISVYSHFVMKRTRLTLLVGGLLALLYGFIYTIILLQDYALLMGSLGIFLVMAAVMVLSRKIDWYAISSE